MALPVPEMATAPAPNFEVTRRLTGKQKAAILVLQLGREESARVLGKLSELELEELSAEVARMGGVPADVSAAVVDEFTSALSDADDNGAHGGFESARELLIRALGPERAADIIERLSHSIVDTPFAFMHHLDARQIVS